ncbi:hypothetical protein GCM10009037_00960 [Halarchaeum grantii]|uniref:Uncharacterized protein n=1 Tax=Halarchaeum grantii TaxID=1193105 RepID=A0A830EY40_9EURY|nr:hypothetical protein GCM10009037_00960 [Halarchaeum grantii]
MTGIAEAPLSGGEVVHRSAGAVVERNEVAVCALEVFDAVLEGVQRLSFRVGEVRFLRIHSVCYGFSWLGPSGPQPSASSHAVSR